MVRDKSFYKTLLLIALPVAFQNLISFGLNMSDTVMVGKLGEVALSGVALANQISFIVGKFIGGVSGGTAVLISQYWGKRDMDRIRTVFSIGLKVCFTFSALITLLCVLFPEFVLSLFTNEQEIILAGAGYLRIVCFSYLTMSISTTLLSMLRGVEVVKIALVVSICSFFVNLTMNYLFIFGKFGAPKMGVNGAGLSTLITRIVEFLVVLIYVFCCEKRVAFRPKDLLRNDFDLWKDFGKYGVPIVIGDLLWGLVGNFKAGIMGHLGSQAVSANSMTDVVLELAMIFIWGLGAGACVIIGKTVGVGDYKRARQYSNTLQILFFCFGFVAALFVYLIRGIAISFYNVSEATKEVAEQFMIIGAITTWATAYAATCFVGINRGAGDGNFVVLVDLICGWLVVLPLAAIAAFWLNMPAPIVFLCTRIDQFVKVVIAFLRLRSNRWIRNVTRE